MICYPKCPPENNVSMGYGFQERRQNSLINYFIDMLALIGIAYMSVEVIEFIQRKVK